MKKLMFLSLAMMLFVAACTESVHNDSDKTIQIQTEQAMSEANRQVGMPAIVNFQEKKIMKQIYELRDQENLICYAYIVDLYGQLHFIGKCIGFGLPYSTQYSSPEKIVEADRMIGRDVAGVGPLTNMPQSEPNGLFMPEGLSATWLLMIDPATNQPRPVYIEPQIIVSPFKLTI